MKPVAELADGLFSIRAGRVVYGVVRGADAASDEPVAAPVLPVSPAVLPEELPPIELEPVLPDVEPVAPLVLPLSEPDDVEPVLLVGAVVLVPVAAPLVASSDRRLQADRARPALSAAMRTVRRIVEVERMQLLLEG